MEDTKHMELKNDREQIRKMISMTDCNFDDNKAPNLEGSQLKISTC